MMYMGKLVVSLHCRVASIVNVNENRYRHLPLSHSRIDQDEYWNARPWKSLQARSRGRVHVPESVCE